MEVADGGVRIEKFREILELEEKYFLVFLSVVFKKFGLVFNEFLPVVTCHTLLF